MNHNNNVANEMKLFALDLECSSSSFARIIGIYEFYGRSFL